MEKKRYETYTLAVIKSAHKCTLMMPYFSKQNWLTNLIIGINFVYM